ncbi:P-loop containing nucleoside triphosphate hydrolase protein [Podospora didyma]|uniref:P-loop containing nucleoside triphosphate hydrolase protein n=1 Tax=Podospora didyma TaxID=330526 RepID=A0AAE0U519_9PEZI|nr:P-loop containing nucleoside triphosphate hydrolase protein [Podospora didyma]
MNIAILQVPFYKGRMQRSSNVSSSSGLSIVIIAPSSGYSNNLLPTMEPSQSQFAETAHHGDETTRQFFLNTTAKRINTDALIAQTLKKQYPNLELVIASNYGIDLLGYAAAGHASFTVLEDAEGSGFPSSLSSKTYAPPARRIDGSVGAVVSNVSFAKFLYKWQSSDFIVYIVNGRDGPYPLVQTYILSTSIPKADSLVLAAGQWGNALHDEVWVWDRGYWQKSAELFNSVKNASWDAVILDPDMKQALIDDHTSFFDSRATYQRLKVPWKRGVIYYGPPGNGKTISIKAMMHTLYDRADDPVPSLYVRSFFHWSGPEAAIMEIFSKARSLAPCYLIFEDLDALVADSVRSYFLNEVDGLKPNDGIFMIGSTNHLDRLDPGISKRPSRFDRKYYFSNPNVDERVAYCHFWQRKLSDNKDIAFPDKLCQAIADITDDFSFAYIQEAFVAALLIIARDSKTVSKTKGWKDEIEVGWVGVTNEGDDDGDDDLDGLTLWVEIQKQVAILREGMEEKRRLEGQGRRYVR